MPDYRTSAALEALERRLRNARRLNVVLAAVCVFLLIVALADGGSRHLTGSAPGPAATGSASATGTTAQRATAADSLARRDPADRMALGPADAPVVMVEYADLRCPYCALFTQQTLPALLSEYVDTGRVRYEFRDLAFFGDQSVDGAVALHAAADQGRFREYLTTLYGAAPDHGHPDLPKEKLLDFARTAGVPDLAAFETALGSADLRAAVTTATGKAQDLGVTSVPFFVVGDRVLSGAQPVDAFRELLDDALAKAGGTR
ncbi:DsbA family protein [Kitasatospora phosalacinea]|uniref:DsbA family protein n=1 Tax=Kitasatospora phosalacinea TaxID=2065 RepID=UPI002553E76B|nr:thioredoxin domain-containing protein [Kitasatospora phosalacinea]